jgi:hypothetical protein
LHADAPRYTLICDEPLTPSLRCKLVDEVVYWNVSFLSG